MKTNHPFDEFGIHLFSDDILKSRIPESVYAKWKTAISKESPLDRATADVIALAMKAWALENGVTHYSHWFLPLTGQTAEKHDSFLEKDDEGLPISHFAGKALIKGETDGSSFPSGGLRATFEARGYTYWDITSPAFIRGKILCIPSMFVSYSGEPLDQKTPLIKSLEVLSHQAARVTQMLGDKSVKHVQMMSGIEQEYFLVDKKLFDQRQDLLLCGRTLLGASAPKGQEFEDHYFGSIPNRVQLFMDEVNLDLWRIGIFAKVEHNEVAPGQFEISPIYAEANRATDQNQIMMDVLKKVAKKHGLIALLHEKPFKGINGSGKHNNWSLITDDGQNLLEPGDKPQENVRFLLVVSAIVKAIDQYPELLRLAASGPGNDHRLGANEAPPAIISVFMGEMLEEILLKVAEKVPHKSKVQPEKFTYIKNLAYIPKDFTDRNRTSPFAFTGNKFEFRMLGSSLSPATSITIIAAILADALKVIADRLEPIKYLQDVREEAIKIVSEIISEHKRVLFNGDGYSTDWVAEAEARKLPNIKSFVETIPYLTDDKALKLFERTGVYTLAELDARSAILYEQYNKTILVEAKAMTSMVERQVLPSLETYLGRLLAIKDYPLYAKKLDTLMTLHAKISDALVELKASYTECTSHSSLKDEGFALRKVLVPAMDHIRMMVDELEVSIPKDLYPIPDYSDLLFLLD